MVMCDSDIYSVMFQNRMSAVVLTVQKENLLAMNFYLSKLR